MLRVCLAVLACTATAVLAYRRTATQTFKILAQKERLRETQMPLEAGFRVVFNSEGMVTETTNTSLLNKNVFSTPDLSAFFHKCMGRALRGGGFTTFIWPNQEGVLKTHVAFSYTENKDAITVVAEPQV